MTSWLAEALAMPLFVAAGLLVIAGASKLRDPAPTGTVLRAVGVPRSRPAARFLGAAEVGAGAAAFAAPSAVTALVVATSYAAFASFLAYLIGRRISVRSCGCVGSRESPPTWTHIAVNLAAMIVAVMAALAPPPAVWEIVASTGPLSLVIALGACASGYASYLALALLPEALSPGTATAKLEGGVR